MSRKRIYTSEWQGDQPHADVACLRYVSEESTDGMIPGDILVLDSADSLRHAVDPAFFAIIACPLCGNLDLITQSQYSGTDSVICGYNSCSCHFRIQRKRALVYLPVS